MKYFAIAVLLVSYFEILGQYLQNKFNKHLCEIGLGVGIIVFLAYAYITTSLLTAMNCNFVIVVIIYSLFFILSIFFITKDIKEVKYRFTWLHLLLIGLIIIFVYYSLNQTLGHLHGFDSTFYLNLVTGNADITNLNSKSIFYGNNGIGGDISYQYTFQSFYYFASYIVFIFKNLFNLYPGTIYIWTFQILFYAFFFSLVLNTYRKIADKHFLQLLLSALLLGFYFCKLYFNSVFGFFGNSYRIVCIGYICYVLIDYFIDARISNKAVVTFAVLASCSVSSSSLFIVFIMSFAIFIINYNHDMKLVRWLSITLFMPLINLLTIITQKPVLSIECSFVLMMTLFILGDFIIERTRRFKPGLVLFIISVVFMVFMSYKVTNNVFDFSAFFNNVSSYADMVINYFDFKNATAIQIIYTCIFFLSFIFALIMDKKNKMLLMCLVIFIVFLNPFCCSYYFKINQVFHRTWDAIINPFMYMYVIYVLFKKTNNKLIETIILSVLSILSFINIKIISPSYYNDIFMISDDYNKLYKMSNNDIDVINHLKEDIENSNICKPKIVTQNLLTQSMIPDGIYLYGRDLTIDYENWTDAEYQVYAIFFEEKRYDNYYQPKDADTDNIQEYINEANIDYLVLDKEWSYKDSKTGEWQPIMYKIDEFKYPFYENDKYVIYHFDK